MKEIRQLLTMQIQRSVKSRARWFAAFKSRYFQRVLDLGECVFTAISHSLSEAKIPSDINFICQIFFSTKCFSKFRVSQVLTKTSPMGYSKCICIVTRFSLHWIALQM